MDTLTLSNLECHFNWELEKGSSRTVPVLIENIKNYMKRDSHWTVAYQCSLAYLFSLDETNNLEQACAFLEEPCEEIRKSQLNERSERYLECEFIIRANRLKLKEFEAKKNALIIDDFIDDELKDLARLWSENKTRAKVFAIKGITLYNFGPLHMLRTIKAFNLALHLVELDPDVCNDWQKLDWLQGLAFSLTRARRQYGGLNPSEKELESWKNVSRWKTNHSLNDNDPIFYTIYAKALMFSEASENQAKCAEMMQHAFNIFLKLDTERKMLYSVVLRTAAIFCTTYRNRIEDLERYLKDRNSFQFFGNHSSTYMLVNKIMNYESENGDGIQLLENGLKRCYDNFFWMDISLTNRYQGTKTEEWIATRYKNLLEKYLDSKKYMGILYENYSRWIFHKKIKVLLYRSFANVELETIDSCIFYLSRAKLYYSDVFIQEKFSYQLLKVLLIIQKDRPEYFTWFRSNIIDIAEKNVLGHYQSVLNDNNSAETRKKFVKESLCYHFLRNGDLEKASNVLEDLVTQHDGVNISLINRFILTVLEKCHEFSLDDLQRCVHKGKREVIALIITNLEAEKKSAVLNDQRFGKEFFNQNGPETFFFFSRNCYEIAAKVLLDFENETSTANESQGNLSQEFIDNVSERITNFLNCNVRWWQKLTYHLRNLRLEMTKAYFWSKRDPETRENEELTEDLNLKTTAVLFEARRVLVSCISVILKTDEPVVYYRTTPSYYEMKHFHFTVDRNGSLDETADNEANVEGRSNSNDEKSTENHHVPSSGGTISAESSMKTKEMWKFKLNYGETGRLIQQAWEETGVSPDKIVEFIERRESYIKNHENNWYSVWLQKMESFGSSEGGSNSDYVIKLSKEKDLKLSGKEMMKRETMNAYDLGHKACEFVEQTFALFMLSK